MKKKAVFGFIEPKVIMSVVVSLIILVVGVLAVATVTTQTSDFSETVGIETTTTTYTERYEDDTNDSNPSADWYGYYEAGLPYANVTNTTDSENTFRMNTTVGSDTTGGVMYNFTTADDYEVFQTLVKINASLHNHTIVTIGSWIDVLGTDGAIAYWEINTTYIAFFVLTTGTDVYTEVYNNTIDSMTWYRLKATMDYDDYSITGELYNVSSTTVMNNSAETCIYEFTNITQSYWAINEGNGDDSCHIWFNDFVLTDTDRSSGEAPVDVMATANSVFGIIGIVLIVAAIMAIVGLVYPYIRS